MYGLTILKTLGAGDFKVIKRDSMLSWLVLMPVILALLIRLLVPRLTIWLFETWAFDLTPYYPVIMSAVFMLAAPVMFGFIIGFLLLDERDDGTLTALQVTPLTLNRYLAYRIGLPIAVTIIMIPFLFPMTGLITMPIYTLLPIAIVAALEAPIFALLMASYAENKVAGFALMKGLNLVILLPVLAYFFQGTMWEYLLAILPTYWPMKTFWVAAAGGNFWGYFVIGLIYHSLLLALLLKRFDKVTHRQ